MYIPKNPEATLLKRRTNKKTNIDKVPMRLVDNFVDGDKKILDSILTGKHEIKQIKVTDIKDENALKIRDKYDTETVKQLISKIRANEELPPIVLVCTPDGDLYLVDGYYRLLAHLGGRRTLIRAVVIDGDLNDALRLRLLANAVHPTPLSREEKRRNVRRVLLNENWWRWSDNIIAPYCGVSSPLVALVRIEILADPSVASAKLSQIDTRFVIRNNKMYEMKVKGINENRGTDNQLPEKTEESLEEILHNAQIINNKIKVQPEEVFLFFKDKKAFPHIIYVGDAQNKKFLEIVFAKRQAGLLKIDFPYRVFFKSNLDRCKKANCGDIHIIPNDNLSSNEYRKFVDRILSTVKAFLIPGSAYYIWTGLEEFEAVKLLCEQHLGKRRSNIIWCKRGLQQSFSYYKRGHETAMWGWTGKSLRCWNGGNFTTDVFNDELFEKSTFELARDTHPCPKPVSIYRKMIEDCLEEGGIVLDAMLGSGTTLVAAQLAGRVGVGIELKPEFAAVAVSRMQDLGLDSIRTNLDELPEILLQFGSNDKSVVAK